MRPAVLVGGTDTALTRYFESPRLLVVAGSRPAWQFCHVEDLCSALEYAVLEKVDGELAVGCDGWLEQEEVEELSGIRRMELPSAVALGAAARLHRIGLTPSPAGDLAYTMYPWVVSGSRLHDAGWRPQWTNEEVLAELLEEVAGRHTVAGAGSAARTPRPRARRARRWPCSARRRWCAGRARRGGGSRPTGAVGTLVQGGVRPPAAGASGRCRLARRRAPVRHAWLAWPAARRTRMAPHRPPR